MYPSRATLVGESRLAGKERLSQAGRLSHEENFGVGGNNRTAEDDLNSVAIVLSREVRKGLLLMVLLPVFGCRVTRYHATRNGLFASDIQPDAGPLNSQLQSTAGRKFLRDTRDHISFSYPATYAVDTAAAVQWQKQAEARHATAHIVAWLSDKRSGANIVVVIVPAPFNLDYIRKGAPTGLEDRVWLRFTVFGKNKFYFYSGGNQSEKHPDQYFYDLNNTILSFAFDGPYSTKLGVIPNRAGVGPIEKLVLSSLKAPVNRPTLASPGSLHYTNARYGFQLTLNGAWKGYEVSQRRMGNNGVTYFVFSVPSSRYWGNRTNLIWLGVQSPQTWRERRIRCDCAVNSARSLLNPVTGATVIGRTATKVFSLEWWNTGRKVRTKYQLNRAIESFTLLH